MSSPVFAEPVTSSACNESGTACEPAPGCMTFGSMTSAIRSPVWVPLAGMLCW